MRNGSTLGYSTMCLDCTKKPVMLVMQKIAVVKVIARFRPHHRDSKSN
jgi:hypothetical protein